MDERRPDDYTTEDFTVDESFINYYLRNNKPDEIFWQEWLLNNPQKKTAANEALEILDTLFLRLPENEYQQELEQMQKEVSEAYVDQKKTPSLLKLLNWNELSDAKKIKRKRAIAFLIPSILILFTAAYFFVQHSSLQNDGFSEKHNSANTPIEFILSDSTVVTLAPNSTLRYQKLFGNIDRKVYLDGEATFHVKRDEVHPFKVYADELVATVLGTIFNVKETHGDSVVLVELLRGKVKVEAENTEGSIILNPNERVVYTRHERSMYKEAWRPLNETSAIQQNHLVFRKNNFEEIALKMKTVFGVTVINKSNKNNWRFTGEFNNTTAKDIVENICLIEQLKYELNGDTILIK